MTKKSQARLARNSKEIPKLEDIASVTVDARSKQLIFTTNDMLINQIHRDGPRIARSFDRLTKSEIAECSRLFGGIMGVLLRHLPRLNDDDFQATSARLLASATNSLVASIEVARHGYPRQYGALARMVVETLATVIALAVVPKALHQFHQNELSSTKCITWSKRVLPQLSQAWRFLSNEFVHIGKSHSLFRSPSPYEDGDQALLFIISSLKMNFWLLDVVTELIYSDEIETPRYWRREKNEAIFDPDPATTEWSERFFGTGPDA